MAAPATPTNFYLQQGNGQVYLVWDLAAGATSYNVLRGTDGITFSTLSSPTVPNYLDVAATVGTQYYYQIQSVNTDGSSPVSPAQSIVPTLTGVMTLGQVRALAQQEADQVNNNFITLPEWNSYINQSYFELYDLLTTLYEDFFIAPGYKFLTNGTSSQFSLPDGSATYVDVNGATAKPFYKLMGVDCGLDNSNNARFTVNKFNFIDRNNYVYPGIQSSMLGVFDMQYRLMGNNLHFIPTPSANQYITAYYIPRVTQLLQDKDMLDGVSGWTEYVIVDAAIKAMEKEESDISALMVRKQALKDRIESSAMNRDAGQPDTISRTRTFNGYGGNRGPIGGY